MNARPEATLDYPWEEAAQPAPGTLREVAPGVHWLRMPLPFALDHINLWLLRDRIGEREGWTLVDCGIDDPATRGHWMRIFTSGLDGLPILRVIVTHMHPDHVGLAHWLTRHWGTPAHECRLWMSAADWYAARIFSRADSAIGGEGAVSFFRRHGLTDPEALEKVRARDGYFGAMVPAVPERFHRLMEGMTIRIGGCDWHCMVGHGHAPEHMALHCAKAGLLISGDMLLPRISTNVSVVYPEPEANPLPLYLASIARLRSLAADTLVLPSHGRPFRGLHRRIAQLEAHHEARLARALAACSEAPRSAADLLPILFPGTLDLHQTTFAMGEAVAHLHALAAEGRLHARDDADGILRWAAA